MIAYKATGFFFLFSSLFLLSSMRPLVTVKVRYEDPAEATDCGYEYHFTQGNLTAALLTHEL